MTLANRDCSSSFNRLAGTMHKDFFLAIQQASRTDHYGGNGAAISPPMCPECYYAALLIHHLPTRDLLPLR
jgi:hypothetical protein